jgi:hypothetical protein
MKVPDAMTSMIEPTIDQSLLIAHKHAGMGDVAHGLLIALRRVRIAIEEVGGFPMVSILDGAIRDRLIIRKLRQNRCGEKETPAAMPRPGAGAPTAELILVDAAETCLVYAAQRPDTSDLLLTVFVLIDRLMETLHSAVDGAELLGWLRNEDEKADAVIGVGPEAAAISVH